MKKRYVLKNKARFALFIVVVLVVSSVMFFATSAYGFQEQRHQEITVKQGDTLWSIAKEFNHKGDIRKYIYEIKNLNNLSSSEIFEGSTMIIPEY